MIRGRQLVLPPRLYRIGLIDRNTLKAFHGKEPMDGPAAVELEDVHIAVFLRSKPYLVIITGMQFATVGDFLEIRLAGWTIKIVYLKSRVGIFRRRKVRYDVDQGDDSGYQGSDSHNDFSECFPL